MDEMSDVIEAAVKALNDKMGSDGFDGSARFVIEGEGSIVVDASGARAADDDADVTLSADADTFESILAGDLDPTAAFMSGRLSVDGDMGMAMKLGSILA
jgi:putative sterol carrier protein